MPHLWITLDWIYRGQMHSLQPDICAKIETELDRLLNREERAGAARASVANERQSERQPTRTSQNPAGERSNGLLVVGPGNNHGGKKRAYLFGNGRAQ
jgi:NAD(P)H-hydrate repair Nnr-like enzyme with NAD(P)H-hydrate epimerase domain